MSSATNGSRLPTVDVFALPTGKIHLPDRWLFEDGDNDMLRSRQFSPDFSFLIKHPLGTNVLFDLGMRKDLENNPTVIKQDYPLIAPVVPRDAGDILLDGPVDPASINAVIFSHLHFDHIGDCTKFPDADIIVGSGSKATTFPGYPAAAKSPFSSAVLEHPRFRELGFETDVWTSFGPFPRAHDFFGDGSFYLVDTPGHMPGHLGAVALTAPDEWVFMGGDCCHHRSLLVGERPMSVTVGPNGTSSFHKDPNTAMRTIDKIRVLEKEGNVFIALAHDARLENVMPEYPQPLNNWKASAWKRDLDAGLARDYAPSVLAATTTSCSANGSPPTRSGHQIAAWVDKPGPDAHVRIRNDVDIPNIAPGEVLIKLECTGVCHSDVHSILGDTPMSTNIAGHEGVGHIVDLGEGVAESYLNKRVGIKWVFSTCQQCEICEVNSTACPHQHNSGRDVPGTFQQYMVSPVKHLTEIPEDIDSEVVAPLLCAGLTIYSALAKASLNPGDWLALPGAGGGLGHIGIQIARKKGYKVIAIDTGEEKRKLCLSLGATEFLDFNTDDIATQVKRITGYGVHAVICTAGSGAAYKQATSLLRNLGTLVCVGLTSTQLPISPFEMVVRGLKVVGSSVGTSMEMDQLLEMAIAGDVVPIVEISEFEMIDEILQKLAKSQINGRVVVRLPQ